MKCISLLCTMQLKPLQTCINPQLKITLNKFTISCCCLMRLVAAARLTPLTSVTLMWQEARKVFVGHSVDASGLLRVEGKSITLYSLNRTALNRRSSFPLLNLQTRLIHKRILLVGFHIFFREEPSWKLCPKQQRQAG